MSSKSWKRLPKELPKSLKIHLNCFQDPSGAPKRSPDGQDDPKTMKIDAQSCKMQPKIKKLCIIFNCFLGCVCVRCCVVFYMLWWVLCGFVSVFVLGCVYALLLLHCWVVVCLQGGAGGRGRSPLDNRYECRAEISSTGAECIWGQIQIKSNTYGCTKTNRI